MNIKLLQWWASLNATNKLIVALAIAICVIWASWTLERNSRISELVKMVTQSHQENDSLNVKLVNCEKNAADRERQGYQEQLNDVKAEKRKSDSMYYAITAARVALKKALNNEN